MTHIADRTKGTALSWTAEDTFIPKACLPGVRWFWLLQKRTSQPYQYGDQIFRSGFLKSTALRCWISKFM